MNKFEKTIEDSRRQVNRALTRYLKTLKNSHIHLIQAMHYSALLGGKRLRPFLVYQTGKLFGLKLESLDAPAAAIECIHAYSLIHDDLPAMDNDLVRRGLPSCHIKFGETTAILAGNALQTLAFSILAKAEMKGVSKTNRLKMILTLATASGAEGMCLGQALDLETEKQKISLKEIEKAHRYKTGALIRAAVKMGGLAAGIPAKPVLKHLDLFAEAIGLAFQIQDDILSVIGNSKTTGKQQGNDRVLGKNTYPSLLGLNIARTKAQRLYHESLDYLKNISALGYDTSTLTTLARYIIERNK